MTRLHFAVAIIAILIRSINSCASPGPLYLYYYDRPPFHFTTSDGSVSGFVANITEDILNQAGIPYVWRQVPAVRILNVLRQDGDISCSPGWYKTLEREKLYNFSLPIYEGKPLVAVTRVDFRVPEVTTAVKIFSIPGINIVYKKGMVTGEYLDGILSKVPINQIHIVTLEEAGKLKMIQAGHFDLTLLTAEEADYYKNNSELFVNLKIIKMTDVPGGDKRFILCNKAVPAAIMEKINATIKHLKLP
ncbi:transporter substrate-binding domain-containing protein [Chromobacterium amazonense]|uniref:substrate-binding periplasmic protein n=1 Tax=Chromobacterium amazonense TaxID=1382803 RepID=UPI00237E59FC|nr:transporter substrate-binding domain-containing protein [Chromobacterium amazonense]MDE1715822.1 transporter substrate-binding domain-containing protein [Chromobacterium amazonense]